MHARRGIVKKYRPGILLLALPLAAVGLASADEAPIAKKADLEAKLAHLTHDLAGKHEALAKRLEAVAHPGAAWEQLVLAFELEPESAGVRAALGYKKTGKTWAGPPRARPAPDPSISSDPKSSKDAPALLAEADQRRQKAAQDLAALAKRAQAGGLAEDARRIAGLALDEDPTNEAARGVLGHSKRTETGPPPKGTSEPRPFWVSSRESTLEDAFAKAVSEAKKLPERKERLDAELLNVLPFGGAYGRADTEHASVLATPVAQEPDVERLARVAEATWRACRALLAGDTDAWKIPGAAGESSGAARPAPDFRPYVLVLSAEQHASFVDMIVKQPDENAARKKADGFSTNMKLPSGRALVAEQCGAAPFRAEVAAHAVMAALVKDSFAGGPCPDWALAGLRVFFGGRATGRNDAVYASLAGTGSRLEWKGGSFLSFRGLVRGELSTTLEGTLKPLFGKHQNELDAGDLVLSFALVDWALERQRGPFVAFLAGLSKDEPALATFEKAFKKPVDAVEADLRAWAREEF